MNNSTRQVIYNSIFSSTFLVSILIVMGSYLRIAGLSDWYFSIDDIHHLHYGNLEDLEEVVLKSVRWHHPPLISVILYYMSKLSNEPLFLRLVSLVPGILSIRVFYFIGKQTGGTISGVFMAFMATFSFSMIIQSQVLRSYSLLIFFLSLAVLSALKYENNRKPKDLYLYFLFAFLAVMSHEASVILIAAIGVVWFCKLVVEDKRLAFIWTAIHLILGLSFFLVTYERMFVIEGSDGSASYVFYTMIYGIDSLIKNFDSVLTDLFFKYRIVGLDNVLFIERAHFPRLLFLPLLFGLVFLYIDKKKIILWFIITATLFNIVLAKAFLYPFIGDRWCIYMVIIISLPVSYFFQYIYDKFSKRVFVTVVCIFIIFFGINLKTSVTGAFSKTDILRGENFHFIIRSSDYYKTLKHLDMYFGDRDVGFVYDGGDNENFVLHSFNYMKMLFSADPRFKHYTFLPETLKYPMKELLFDEYKEDYPKKTFDSMVKKAKSLNKDKNKNKGIKKIWLLRYRYKPVHKYDNYFEKCVYMERKFYAGPLLAFAFSLDGVGYKKTEEKLKSEECYNWFK